MILSFINHVSWEWISKLLFGFSVTISLYLIANYLHQRWRALHPLALTSLSLIAILLITDIPYDDYAVGGNLISFFLGPATVALAAPLYRRRKDIRQRLWGILGSISIGSAVGIMMSALLIMLFHGSHELLLATLPKSATAAISYELAELVGGPGELAAVLTVLTGLTGSMLGPPLLRLLRLDATLPLGIAIGTAAHGIGTSRLLRDSEEAGAYSGLAMGLTGIIVSLLMVPVYFW